MSTKSVEEYRSYFRKLFQSYQKKYKEWPTTCYCPIPIYDDIIEAIKNKAYHYDYESHLYQKIYSEILKDHYLTLFETRLYRSIVTEIDFNVPNWKPFMIYKYIKPKSKKKLKSIIEWESKPLPNEILFEKAHKLVKVKVNIEDKIKNYYQFQCNDNISNKFLPIEEALFNSHTNCPFCQTWIKRL
jgi:hypothetical protein